MKEQISKIAAARYQLNSALELFFENRTSLAIETLFNAAWHILKDLLKHAGLEASRDWMREDHLHIKESELWEILNRNWLFLKHAKEDPNDVLNFEDSHQEICLFFVINDFAMLAQQSHIMDIYQLWFIAKNPALFFRYEQLNAAHRLFPGLTKYDQKQQKDLALSILKDPPVFLEYY